MTTVRGACPRLAVLALGIVCMLCASSPARAADLAAFSDDFSTSVGVSSHLQNPIFPIEPIWVTATMSADGRSVTVREDLGVLTIGPGCSYTLPLKIATCPAVRPLFWVSMGGGFLNDRLTARGDGIAVSGGGGNDRIDTRDGGMQGVDCGEGAKDVVVADSIDFVAGNCELVTLY